MAASEQDIETGASALRFYAMSLPDGWQASFVMWPTYETGAKLIVNTWDVGPKDETDGGRVLECGKILYHELSAAGYGDRVSPDQCVAAAHAVLVAVGRIKG